MEKLRLKIFDMKESLVNRLEPIKHLSRITKIKSTIISKKFEIIGTSICIVSPKSAYREEKALRNEIFELEKQLSRTYESLGKKAENSGNLKKAEKYYKKSGFSMVGFYASHKEEDVYFKRKLANEWANGGMSNWAVQLSLELGDHRKAIYYCLNAKVPNFWHAAKIAREQGDVALAAKIYCDQATYGNSAGIEGLIELGFLKKALRLAKKDKHYYFAQSIYKKMNNPKMAERYRQKEKKELETI